MRSFAVYQRFDAKLRLEQELMVMGARRIRRDQRRADMAESRTVNGHLKARERERRQTRMLGLLKAGKYPYTPSIMSWVSRQLDKPSTKITSADVTSLVKDLSAPKG